MAWKTILPGREVPDARTDAKAAVSFGGCRVSDKAVYLTNREYLPLDAVSSARLYSSQMNSHGCCGLGLPVWYVLLYYGAERPLKLLNETQDQAEKLLREILSRRPGIERLEANGAGPASGIGK